MPEVENIIFVYEEFPWEFRDELDALTAEGYQPHGNPTVNENVCNDCSTKYKFFQVMVKYKR